MDRKGTLIRWRERTLKKFFFILVISFAIILVINITWGIVFLYGTAINGIQAVLEGRNLVESITVSIYLKWILLTDFFWLISFLIYILQRKHYKTDAKLHYLKYEPITNPIICTIVPAFNEEKSIENVVNDFKNQEFVKYVIVIDNKSSDQTAKLAEKCGAIVIRNKENKGASYSYILGLKEALKTDANVFVTTEADGSFNAYDISKMIPYLNNCDMVIGTRQVQVLTEKGNIRSGIIHVWGNYILAKLIQMKYFSFLHLGIVNLTDVFCLYRMIRRKTLEKIIDQLTYPNSDEPIGGEAFPMHFTTISIENNARIVEIPVTFNIRVGISKYESEKKLSRLKWGLIFLKSLLTS